ncbi:glycosyltransferase family 4 protein [Haloferula sp.]|uniref:glycosyltransferase family 4 protein n=1 Tax=Haloferula sp. TaxID=2497595 RepID=UPI003C777F0D
MHRTLAIGKFRIPYKLLGRSGACEIHDRRVANWLRRNPNSVDLIHAWPLASLRTIRVAKSLGIPVMVERINAHIRFAFEIVEEECRRIGIKLPPGHDHELNPASLKREEAEYEESDYLLCPSEFVARTFTEKGFSVDRILRHQYGFDESRFRPRDRKEGLRDGKFTAIYAGVCEPRKGLHYALEAWHDSGACELGEFRICGQFVPGYAEKLSKWLSHPSVKVMGHRSDLPELMRNSDVFILPSVEEGSALVTYEARGSGCVLLVSENSGAPCRHGYDAFLHPIRSKELLTEQLRELSQNRELLATMRKRSLETAEEITWSAAGESLAQAYRAVSARA